MKIAPLLVPFSLFATLVDSFVSSPQSPWTKLALHVRPHRTTGSAKLLMARERESTNHHQTQDAREERLPLDSIVHDTERAPFNSISLPLSTLSLFAVLFGALPADAAGVVPTALWAYFHYAAMLLVFGCLVAERSILKPQMALEEEMAFRKIDIAYWISLIFLLVSGYERAADFGKGVDYYSHETLFWLKMSFAGVLFGCALFPSITMLKRGQDKDFEPISDKLYARMKTVLNAEISAVLSIPLLASLMARGVLYVDNFPWPAGLAFTLLVSGGASFFYGKQAVTWTED